MVYQWMDNSCSLLPKMIPMSESKLNAIDKDNKERDESQSEMINLQRLKSNSQAE